MLKFDLTGKNALVTGGGTGIGRATAIEFARLGARVVINYNRSGEAAAEVVKEIKSLGSDAVALQADVTDEEQVARLVGQAASFGGGRLDILLNNAGTLVQRCEIEKMDISLWNSIMDVNITSTFLVSKHVIPVMKKLNSGRIINLASQAAHDGGGPGAIPYAASKAAIQAFTKGLAKELAPYSILVNCLSPGLITTRFHDQYNTPENRARVCEKIPLKREGLPEEVAGAAVFLATGYGSYITGETIQVNGGVLMI